MGGQEGRCGGVVEWLWCSSDRWMEGGGVCRVCGMEVPGAEGARVREVEERGRELLASSTKLMTSKLITPLHTESPDYSKMFVTGRAGGLDAVAALEGWLSGEGAETLHTLHPLVGEVQDFLSHVLVAQGDVTKAYVMASRAAAALATRLRPEIGAGEGGDWEGRERDWGEIGRGRDGGGVAGKREGRGWQREEGLGVRDVGEVGRGLGEGGNMMLGHARAWVAFVAALDNRAEDCLHFASTAASDFRSCLGSEHHFLLNLSQLISAAFAAKMRKQERRRAAMPFRGQVSEKMEAAEEPLEAAEEMGAKILRDNAKREPGEGGGGVAAALQALAAEFEEEFAALEEEERAGVHAGEEESLGAVARRLLASWFH